MAFKGKASNFFVWIILALLIVGLAGFGVTSFGTSAQSVASVGETEISLQDYGNALNRELNARQQDTGERMSFAQAQATGVDTGVLQGLLATASLDEAAREAGLSVGDTAVSERILQIDAFTGLNGEFDRQAYESALRRNGMTVSEFEDQVRREIARNLLQTALAGGIAPAPAYSDAIYNFIAEQRSFTYATLDASDLNGTPPTPSDEDVQAFYDENPDLFTLPQRKMLTYGWLSPEMLLDSVELDEEALRQAYADRSDEFMRPAMRVVERLAFSDEAEAEAARARVNAEGDDAFDALLAERDLAPEDIDLGEVTEADLGAAGAEVFALEDTGIVGPLPSSVGPALFRVNAILEAQTTSFEEAEPALRDELAHDRARRVIEGEIEQMDDLLAGGATIEDLGRETDMKTGQMDWAGGLGEGLAAYGEFQAAAEKITEGDFPEITILEDGGIFALRLDGIVPSELQPLNEVKGRATDLAAQKKLRESLTTLGEARLAAFDRGESFDSLGMETTSESNLTRRDFIESLPPKFLERVFQLSDGETALIEGDDSVYVVRLDGIQPPDLNDPAGEFLRSTLNQQASQTMSQDILLQVIRAVQERSGITVNQAALNAVNSQIQ